MKRIGRTILSCALILGLLLSYALPAATLEAGEVTMNGAGADGKREIRVDKGGSASVTYTLSYKDPAAEPLRDIGSAYFFVGYSGMTYHEDADSDLGKLDRNDIYQGTAPELSEHLGQIRIVKVAMHSKTFSVTIPFTDIQETNTLSLYPMEFFGESSSDPVAAPQLTYVKGQEPEVIVQVPVTVTITGGAAGNSVSCETASYAAGRDTFAPGTGSEKTLQSGDKLYVDSGTKNATPVFSVTETGQKRLAEVRVNGTDVLSNCKVTEAGSQKTVTLPAPIDADTDVAFVFTQVTYQVQFHVGGGSAVPAVTAPAGTVTDLTPYTTTRTGYVFDGWYKEESLQTPLSSVSGQGGTISVYAAWKPIITYEAQAGGTLDGDTTVSGTTGAPAPSVPTPVPDSGYQFDGWFTTGGAAATPTTTLIIGPVTFVAHFSKIPVQQYTLTYNTTGGDAIGAEKAAAGTKIALTKKPTRAGYLFDGWYADAALTQPVASITLDGDKTVYAKWSKEGATRYTVTFRTDGGSAVAPVTGDAGTKILLTQTTSKAGYTFSGWYADAALTTPVTSVTLTDDTTVYAKWEVQQKPPVTYYTLTFVTSAGAAPEPLVMPAGSIINVDAHLPSWNGAVFGGWYLDEALTNRTSQVVLTGDMQVYAKWAQPGYYTLSFAEDGGSAVPDVVVQAGTEIPLTQTTVRDGYRFTGWYTDIALTNRVTTVLLNQNTTVYAGWDKSGSEYFDRTSHHISYIIGYSDGTVRPTKSITRAEVATIIYRLLRDEVKQQNTTITNSFSDVKDDDWFVTQVSSLAKMGILEGYPDGTFRPNSPITRAEFATLAVRLTDAPETKENPFSDCAGHWAEAYILRAAAAGLVQGSDGKFRPADNITRAEAVTIVNRMLDRRPETMADLLDGMIVFQDNPENAWYYLDVQEAANDHICQSKGDGIHEVWISLENDTGGQG